MRAPLIIAAALAAQNAIAAPTRLDSLIEHQVNTRSVLDNESPGLKTRATIDVKAKPNDPTSRAIRRRARIAAKLERRHKKEKDGAISSSDLEDHRNDAANDESTKDEDPFGPFNPNAPNGSDGSGYPPAPGYPPYPPNAPDHGTGGDNIIFGPGPVYPPIVAPQAPAPPAPAAPPAAPAPAAPAAPPAAPAAPPAAPAAPPVAPAAPPAAPVAPAPQQPQTQPQPSPVGTQPQVVYLPPATQTYQPQPPQSSS